MNSIDLFCGAGGMSLGLKSAGFVVKIANELEKEFAETYKLNHKETLMVQADVRRTNFSEILKNNFSDQKIHLVCGGPPCQGFSTVGKKNELDDRNSLYWEFLRVVAEINPDFVFFENVSGFKRMYQGKMFDCLVDYLSNNLKYTVHSNILNAADFGLPQIRLRTIVVAHKPEFKFEFPVPQYGADNTIFVKKNSYLTLEDAISDLPTINSGEISSKYLHFPLNEFQLEMRQNCNVLTEHCAPNHGESLIRLMKTVPYGGSILNVPLNLRPKSYFQNTYARLVWEKPVPTITRNFGTPSSSRCIHPVLDRGLTTREGARLQGFPDDYQFFGKKGSKNLQIGNAVPPIFAKVIGMKIRESLKIYYNY